MDVMRKMSTFLIIFCGVVIWCAYVTVTYKITLLERNAEQSSSSSAQVRGAGDALDGSQSTCTETNGRDENAWWRVTLDKIYLVEQLTLYNSMKFPERLSNINILVGNTKNVHEQSLCYFYNKTVPAGSSDNITCTRPLTGTYVTIQKANSSGNRYLTLCELEVYGIENIPLDGSKAEQSTSDARGNIYGAEKAVDHTFYPIEACTHTQEEPQPWWQIQLDGHFTVLAVRIYNRVAAYRRLRELDVMVGLYGRATTQRLCKHYVGPVPSGSDVIINCNLKGNFVRIIKTEKGRPEQYDNGTDTGKNGGYLTLCEVEVFGFEERAYCGDPGTPFGTTKSGSSYFDKDVVTYSCSTGWTRKSGDTNRTCRVDTTWSGSAIACERVSCANPGTPLGAIKNGTSYLRGDSVTYTCRPGWERMYGDVTRICKSSFTWSGSSIVCEKAQCISTCSNGGIYFGLFIGGVFAGITLVLLIILILYLVRRRQLNIKNEGSSSTQEQHSPEPRDETSSRRNDQVTEMGENAYERVVDNPSYQNIPATVPVTPVYEPLST